MTFCFGSPNQGRATPEFHGMHTYIYICNSYARIHRYFRAVQPQPTQFPAHAQHKLLSNSNGLAPHLLRDDANSLHKLHYASWPCSGLDEVLRWWSHIRAGARQQSCMFMVTLNVGELVRHAAGKTGRVQIFSFLETPHAWRLLVKHARELVKTVLRS